MKKLLLTIILSIFFMTGVNAQNSVVDNPSNRAYFGLRAGLDIACPGKIKSGGVGIGLFESGAGFNIGGIYNIPVVANFYIEPGLNLYYDTYSLKKKAFKLIEDFEDFKSFSIRKFGMRIPVMAGYHFDFSNDFSLHIFTGPELEIGFTADGNLSGHGIDVSESLYDEDGGMNRFDCLWDLGVGFGIQHFYVGVTGAFGLCNMIDGSGVTFHENRVSINLGYNF